MRGPLQVFRRGQRDDGHVHCYLCDRVLVREFRTCRCFHSLARKLCECGGWELEHVLAKSPNRALLDVPGNLLPACIGCNSAAWKGSRQLQDCIAQRGMNVCTWAGDCSDLNTEVRGALSEALALKRAQAAARAQPSSSQPALLFPSEQLETTEHREWKEVGNGAQAIVYKARWRRVAADGQTYLVDVAIKAFSLRADERATLIMHKEIGSLARVGEHKHIVAYHGTFETKDNICLVMQFFPLSLALALRLGKGFRLWHVLYCLASGLAFLHANALLHRDIKPANALLGYARKKSGDFDVAVLADFGLATDADNELHTANCGTGSFRAPEVRGGHYGPPSDVYSLGKTFESVSREVQTLTREDVEELQEIIKHTTTTAADSRWTAEEVRLWIAQKHPLSVS